MSFLLEKIRLLSDDSHFRNSLFLMLATGVMAGFGFFFWLITAHVVPASEVGIAATLISVMNMIAVLSLIGFDTATIRYLANTPDKNAQINTSLILVGGAGLVLSLAFVMLVTFVSPELAFISHHLGIATIFIVLTALSAVNMMTDAIFLAYRKTSFTLAINTIFSFVKMLLPFAFFPFGAFGIFAAAAVAQSIGSLLSMWALIKRFDYTPSIEISKRVILRVWKYCSGNYVSGVLSLLPLTLLPILITNVLGTPVAGYFYIVMMIANILYVIPAATTRSLFAEGSYDEASLMQNTRKTVVTVTWFMVPAMLVLYFGGSFILHFFGKEYSEGGVLFLQLVTITGIFVTITSIYSSIFRVTHDLRSLIIVNAVFCVSTIAASVLFLPMGLPGIGVAFLLGNACSAFAAYLCFQLGAARQSHEQIVGWSRKDTMKKSPIGRAKESIVDLAGRLECAFYDTIVWRKNAVVDEVHHLAAKARRARSDLKLRIYPDMPHSFHTITKIAKRLGYEFTNELTPDTTRVIYFKDATYNEGREFMERSDRPKVVINGRCSDISKTQVERVFTKIFGYGMEVDPTKHQGTYVRKSNENALHDGMVIDGPTAREPGYIYQRLINNVAGNGLCEDLRYVYINGVCPLVFVKYRSCKKRFASMNSFVRLQQVTDVFSDTEIEKIHAFCKAVGLDFGELDILRDKDDGRIYIVDVNNTPGGLPSHMERGGYEKAITAIAKTFEREFLTP